jgi:hypothetical protein
MNHETILDTIETSSLSPAEYRTARRLLDRVSNQWTVYLTRADACEVCGTKTWAGARKGLNRLEELGIIQLHTNNCAYITFVDRAESGTYRAETTRERAETTRPELTEPRQNGAPARRNDAKRAESGTYRAETTRPPIGSGSGSRKEGRKEDPTYLPEGGAGGETDSPEQPSPDEQARSVALLMDEEVGAVQKLAMALAQTYSYEQIRRQVFRFMRDRAKGDVKHAGVLRRRLEDHAPASITQEDRASPLWQRHHSEEETAALETEEIRRRYIPDEYADIILG